MNLHSNTKKYLSYREAWRRIKLSNESGFPLEAVTLCESIIADRLLSYVAGEDSARKIGTHTPFAKLINEWRKIVTERPDAVDFYLIDAVDKWRDERNHVVHSLTKSTPGAPTDDVSDFLARANAAARAGTELARAVCNWHSKQLAAKKRATAVKDKRDGDDTS